MRQIWGQKHIIGCRCILPTLKNRKDPPLHKFVVFSVIATDGTGKEAISEKFVQCNNCGVVHRVFELGKSEILANREELSSCLTIEDIKFGLPENVTMILESYDCDLPTYEYVKFMTDYRSAGHVILTKEENEEKLEGKMLKYDGKVFKIEPFSAQTKVI